MKTRWVLTTLTACALSAFAVPVTLNPQQVAAQEAQTVQVCKNATLKGAYSFELS